MARRPSSKAAPGARSLAEAISFLRFGIADEGMLTERYVAIRDRMMIQRNSELAAGHPIEEDFRAAVDATALRKAVEKVTGALTLAQDAESLTLRSSSMKVRLMTIPLDEMTPTAPDPIIAPLNEHFGQAVRDCLPLIKESGTRIIDYSLLSMGQSIVGCHKGKVILEVWHGNDMPPGIAFPFKFCKALIASKEKVKGFGFSGETFTVHFENGAWLKTQLIATMWPDVSQVLDPMNLALCEPISRSFFEAVADIQPFTENNMVEVEPTRIRAESETQTAEREIAPVGIPENGAITMNVEHLLMIGDHAKNFDFTGNARLHAFTGDTRRGCIVKVG